MSNVEAGGTPAATQRANDPGDGTWLASITLVLITIAVLGLILFVAIMLLRPDGDAAETSEPTVAQVQLSEFAIEGDLTVPAGAVRFEVVNEGGIEHNFAIRGLDVVSADLASGESDTLALDSVAAGDYEVYCAIPGHESSGMLGTLTVTAGDAGAPADGGGHGGHGGENTDWAALDQAMMDSILAFPAETEGRGNPILEPTEILADGTKVFDLTAAITPWEVEPGKIVDAWTYNGVVPAPQILLDQGDKIQVRVTNNLPMGTDVHWHGVHTPHDQDGVAPITQELIAPNGGTFTYEFTAEDKAIGMYHAHNHAQMQVVNGMFGVIRIGDNPIPYGQTISGVTIPEDLELALDMPMILNDAGTIGYSLNGKSFPATDPIALSQGEWASLTYYNEGLQIHPMHLHQFPQLVYAKDGVQLEHPYWVDTLNVAPGERYSVLFRADDAGTWVFHCHILTHVERDEGMFGMVTAIVVDENADFDDSEHPVDPTNWRGVVAGALPEEADA